MRKHLKSLLFLLYLLTASSCRSSTGLSDNSSLSEEPNSGINETLLGLQKRTFKEFSGVFYKQSGKEQIFICPRFLLSIASEREFSVGNEYRFTFEEEREISYYFDQPIRFEEEDFQIECTKDYTETEQKNLTICMTEEYYSGYYYGSKYYGPSYYYLTFSIEKEEDLYEKLDIFAERSNQSSEEIKSLCYSTMECLAALRKDVEYDRYAYDFLQIEDGDFIFIRQHHIQISD